MKYSKVTINSRHIFLRLRVENEDMTDVEKKFNLVLCPNDQKVIDLIKMMSYSGLDILEFLFIGPYRYNFDAQILDLDSLKKVQFMRVKMREQPDLLRHWLVAGIRTSEVTLHNAIKPHELYTAESFKVISKYCNIRRDHFYRSSTPTK